MVKFVLTVHSLVCCGRESWETSDKGVLPPSILTYAIALGLPFPILFRVRTSAVGRDVSVFGEQHCGVSEFTGDEGHAFLPWWMLNNLGLEEGGKASFEIAKGIRQGKFCRLRPHEGRLIELASSAGPRLFFERCFGGKYTMLSRGETITVEHEGSRFCVDVLAVSSSSAAEQEANKAMELSRGGAEETPETVISLCGHVDLEVDFAPPLDATVEEDRQPTAAAAAALRTMEEAPKPRRRRKWAPPPGQLAAPTTGFVTKAFTGRGATTATATASATTIAAAASAARQRQRTGSAVGRRFSPTAAESVAESATVAATVAASSSAFAARTNAPNDELRSLHALRQRRRGRSSPPRSNAATVVAATEVADAHVVDSDGGGILGVAPPSASSALAAPPRLARELRQAQIMSIIDVDASAAVALLQESGWDVAAAAERYFNRCDTAAATLSAASVAAGSAMSAVRRARAR